MQIFLERLKMIFTHGVPALTWNGSTKKLTNSFSSANETSICTGDRGRGDARGRVTLIEDEQCTQDESPQPTVALGHPIVPSPTATSIGGGSRCLHDAHRLRTTRNIFHLVYRSPSDKLHLRNLSRRLSFTLFRKKSVQLQTIRKKRLLHNVLKNLIVIL